MNKVNVLLVCFLMTCFSLVHAQKIVTNEAQNIINGKPINDKRCNLASPVSLSVSSNVHAAYNCWNGFNDGLIMISTCHRGGSKKKVTATCKVIANIRALEKTGSTAGPGKKKTGGHEVKNTIVWNGDLSKGSTVMNTTGCSELTKTSTSNEPVKFTAWGIRVYAASNAGGAVAPLFYTDDDLDCEADIAKSFLDFDLE